MRFDNGPEFIAHAVADWCRFNGVDTVFIDPGSPWQNAWIESFNGRLRDELLNGWHFDTLLEAQVLIEDWRIDYNINRPHSAHGDLTPTEFAASLDHPNTNQRANPRQQPAAVHRFLFSLHHRLGAWVSRLCAVHGPAGLGMSASASSTTRSPSVASRSSLAACSRRWYPARVRSRVSRRQSASATCS